MERCHGVAGGRGTAIEFGDEEGVAGVEGGEVVEFAVEFFYSRRISPVERGNGGREGGLGLTGFLPTSSVRVLSTADDDGVDGDQNRQNTCQC